MTTTETMTIRKGLKELKVLNNRISDLRDYNFIQYYKNDNKFIGALTPDQATADIKATMDKLNAMIARREAINRAVMAQNAQSVIKVKKFITFAHIGENHEDEYEEISLAIALNRKKYYRDIVLPMLVVMRNRAVNCVDQFNKATENVQARVEQEVRDRFAAASANNNNVSMIKQSEAISDAYNKRLEERKAVLVDPLNATQAFVKYIEYVEDYVNNIDSELSNKTETIEITFTY